MTQKLKKATVYRYETKLNEYREEQKGLTAICEIEIAVSTTNGAFNSANNVKTTNSTHTAFTKAVGLREDDIIDLDGRQFQIDFINDYGRFPVLYLKAVEEVGK